ncbi:hypothetical protein FISHEDRAFT_74550 [Fistulina hepatica ATCC 64428]|uniref:Uncharacterized protein n=1 Tax=Fistulina hepatica ATCC 64428 TaxID=1128425 RepID=A0A0D7A9V7_9AGAR|nr:hypothetical protein FISHEDRAFT_74550 [Fistulina hepatica ATCC 64428]
MSGMISSLVSLSAACLSFGSGLTAIFNGAPPIDWGPEKLEKLENLEMLEMLEMLRPAQPKH